MATNRVQTDGIATATDFIGRRQTDLDVPQCFLVRATAGHVIPGHFHAVDQFQVFVEGSAQLGRFPLKAGSIHYTDAFTPYGPIVAAEEGYAYFTLRPQSTTSYHKMPAEARLLKESRSASTSKRRMLMAEAEDAHAGEAGIATLFAEPDGVGAYRLDVGAGEALRLAEAPPHGAFVLIVEGKAVIGGRHFGPKSCLWLDADEPLPGDAVAGREGLTAIVAAFGPKAA